MYFIWHILLLSFWAVFAVVVLYGAFAMHIRCSQPN